MAGDIGIREQIFIVPKAKAGSADTASLALSLAQGGGRIMHRYGDRVLLAEVPAGGDHPALAAAADLSGADLSGLSETEQLGVQAFALRQSDEYAAAKAARPHQGESWEGPDGVHPLVCTDVGMPAGVSGAALAAEAGAPALSARLTGKVAVGIVIVNGPTAALQFTTAERTKVAAEVQNGLGWLGAQNDAGAVAFSYEIKNVSITEQPLTGTPTSDAMEARFRDPAMAKLGYAAGMANVTKYANDLRTKLGTDWAYVAFFTKYPLGHFAYASIGGPRLVMDYANDGWGPDNIDRVFTHESGHIFGAPDEYAASGCDCGGSWGFYGKPNTNCENCAPGGGVTCLMKKNDWAMCSVTPYHLGFQLAEQRYSGVFRAGTGKYALWVNASWDSFKAKWQEWAGQGLRLADLDIVQSDNTRRYNGVWVAGTDAYGLWVNAKWDAFVAKWKEWAAQGLRLVSLEIVRDGSDNLYSGVFRAGTDAYGLWGNATWESFEAKWKEWSAQNLRLVDLTITNFGNERRYSGVFRAGTDGYGLWVNSEWAQFEAKWKEWSAAKLRLIDLEITSFGGQRRFSGVFRGGTDAYGLWVTANYPSFRAKWEEWNGQNLRLIDLEVTDPANTVNAPTPGGVQALALSLGMKDDGEGDGFGGIFGADSAGDGDAADLDTGGRSAGSAAGGQDSGEGFGGMSGGSGAAGQQADASGEDGFGGVGGLSGGTTTPGGQPSGGAEDGFGGIGGDDAGPSGANDLDTGGLGGVG